MKHRNNTIKKENRQVFCVLQERIAGRREGENTMGSFLDFLEKKDYHEI